MQIELKRESEKFIKKNILARKYEGTVVLNDIGVGGSVILK
jgi:hypothetical protein